MTPERTARVVLWLAIVVPLLGLAPLNGALGVALSLALVVAACGGWGLLVRRLAGAPEVPAPLVVLWGLAALTALAGLAIAAHVFGHAVQRALIVLGAVLHVGLLVLDRDAAAARISTLLRDPGARHTLLLALVAGGLAVLHVLGAAGDLTAGPFDDDGSLPGQLRRLLDTGTLGDPIGYARSSQLGGHVAISALVTSVSAPSLFRAADGLGFALVLWLGLAHLRARTASAGIWAVLGAIALASYPVVTADASPRWLPVALILGAAMTFAHHHPDEDDRLLWPLGLVAGALATVRSELLPVAVALLLAAALVGIGRSGGGRRAVALIAVPILVAAPYALVRHLAVSSVPSAALDHGHGVVVPLLVTIAILIPVIWIVVCSLAGTPMWIALATLAGVAAAVTQVSGSRAMLAPILVGGGLALGISVLRTTGPEPRAAALVIALLATSLIYDARETPGRARWVRRYSELAQNIEFLRHAYPPAVAPDPYGAVLAKAPAGTVVAAWVTRPELLDYAGHRILDLRTPRSAARRMSVLRAVTADYLLFEDDSLTSVRASRDLLYRFACPPGTAARYCADELEAFALDHAAVAREGNVVLLRLRGSPD